MAQRCRCWLGVGLPLYASQYSTGSVDLVPDYAGVFWRHRRKVKVAEWSAEDSLPGSVDYTYYGIYHTGFCRRDSADSRPKCPGARVTDHPQRREERCVSSRLQGGRFSPRGVDVLGSVERPVPRYRNNDG